MESNSRKRACSGLSSWGGGFSCAIAGWGLASGFYGPLTLAALPNFFGRTHLGSIQGVMSMWVVVASALGPSVLAAVKVTLGSYRPGLYALCALPLMVLAASPFIRDPSRTR